MPCYYPRTVWRTYKHLNKKSGLRKTLFRKPSLFMPGDNFLSMFPLSKPREFYDVEEFQIPGCKPKCVGCQERYSRDWAVRAWHHAQRHDANCFITLTYNEEFVPRSLNHRTWQLFMKRFRRAISVPVSFFMCGEYGSLNMRPHFHACIFGFDFPDRKLFSVRDGVRLDTSEMLSRFWSCPKSGRSFGFSTVGDVSFQSAAYIARYVAKKAQRAADSSLDGRKPEYSKCSLKRPIGKDWFYAFMSSVYPDDAVTLDGGFRARPPRYYDKLLALTDQELSATIVSARKEQAKLSPDNSPQRLRERESVKLAQFNQLKRSSL